MSVTFTVDACKDVINGKLQYFLFLNSNKYPVLFHNVTEASVDLYSLD